MEPQIPTIGRTVHYVLKAEDLPEGKKHNAGQERPAVITRTWHQDEAHGLTTDCVQLTVFLDGANDTLTDKDSPLLVKSSVEGSSGPVDGCWHWPERI